MSTNSSRSRTPPRWRPWKDILLTGDTQAGVPERLAEFLGALHAGTEHASVLDPRLDDVESFEHLRVDPYYRTVLWRIRRWRTPSSRTSSGWRERGGVSSMANLPKERPRRSRRAVAHSLRGRLPRRPRIRRRLPPQPTSTQGSAPLRRRRLVRAHRALLLVGLSDPRWESFAGEPEYVLAISAA